MQLLEFMSVLYLSIGHTSQVSLLAALRKDPAGQTKVKLSNSISDNRIYLKFINSQTFIIFKVILNIVS